MADGNGRTRRAAKYEEAPERVSQAAQRMQAAPGQGGPPSPIPQAGGENYPPMTREEQMYLQQQEYARQQAMQQEYLRQQAMQQEYLRQQQA